VPHSLHVIDVVRDKLKVNVSDRLREALERLDQAIDRLDASTAAGAGGVPVAANGAGSANTAAIAAKLDRMIQRVEAALAD
jgi:hypothetical protein